jgi:threonine dehydratase
MTPPRLSLERIRSATTVIDPVFLHTPFFESEPLGLDLGVQVFLKVETLNPIRSFKGRGAELFVAREAGETPLVCASAGNFGQAMAYATRARALPLTVFASLHANPLKVERMRALGARVRRFGEDFDAAKEAARAYADAHGARFVEDGREVAISEGAGTLALEICAAEPRLDALFVPLGNGALLAGVATVLRALQPSTRIVAVAAAGAPAMLRSLERGEVVVGERADTIADGIAVRVPVPEAVADLHGLVDELLLVDDAAMVAAMRRVQRQVGVVVEPAGGVGLAGIVARAGAYQGARVATILCGSNITEEQARVWLA